MKIDEDGLQVSYRCERLLTVEGKLLCDGVEDCCSYVDAMRKGCYYDCIIIGG